MRILITFYHVIHTGVIGIVCIHLVKMMRAELSTIFFWNRTKDNNAFAMIKCSLKKAASKMTAKSFGCLLKKIINSTLVNISIAKTPVDNFG